MRQFSVWSKLLTLKRIDMPDSLTVFLPKIKDISRDKLWRIIPRREMGTCNLPWCSMKARRRLAG
jgi:hypothetical protein